MNLQLRDKDDTVHDLAFEAIKPKSFRPTFDPLRFRVGHKDRLGKAGGAVTGDKEPDVRNVTLAFETVSQDDAAYRNSLNELLAFFNPANSPHYLVDTDQNIRTRIYLNSISDRPANAGLERIIGRGSLSLKLIDSYFEDLVENEVTPTGGSLANNESFVVNNGGYVNSYPVFKLRPAQQNTDFLVRNETTGAAFLLGSNSFLPGTEFIVDCQNGTIFLSNGVTQVEQSIALADGSGMIFLQPGNNEIAYESIFGSVEIDVLFRRRYGF